MNRSIRSSIAGVGLALALTGGVVATASVAAPEPAVSLSPTAPDNTNQPEYWEAYLEDEGYTNVECTKDDQPYNDGYTVPAGDWLLLVLKAGSGPDENFLVENPVAGETYFHDSGKEISHVILCSGDEPTTPTTPEPTSPEPTSPEPTSPEPTSPEPTSPEPTSPEPTTPAPTTPAQPTGPIVETDGVTPSSGPNAGLVGGAALLLAGGALTLVGLRRRHEL